MLANFFSFSKLNYGLLLATAFGFLNCRYDDQVTDNTPKDPRPFVLIAPQTLAGIWASDCHKRSDFFEIQTLHFNENHLEIIHNQFGDEGCQEEQQRYWVSGTYELKGERAAVKQAMLFDLRYESSHLALKTPEAVQRHNQSTQCGREQWHRDTFELTGTLCQAYPLVENGQIFSSFMRQSFGGILHLARDPETGVALTQLDSLTFSRVNKKHDE